MCHISELTDEPVKKPEDAVEIGQVLKFRIVKFDQQAGKIGLSAKQLRGE